MKSPFIKINTLNLIGYIIYSPIKKSSFQFELNKIIRVF